MVLNQLQVADENYDLGKNMDGKYSELARKATKRKIGGLELPANIGRVKSYFSLRTYVNVRIQFYY